MSESYFVHMRTFSGKDLNLTELRPEDVSTEDIAHHLSLINRFGGATRYPITVSQHSVYVARLVKIRTGDRDAAFAALYHDAGEAYIGDMTKWLKGHPQMYFFRHLESYVQGVIHQALKIPVNLPQSTLDAIEWADRVMVRFEGEHKKGCGRAFTIIGGEGKGRQRHPNYPPLTPAEIDAVGAWAPWSWRQSKESFLVHHRLYSTGELSW